MLYFATKLRSNSIFNELVDDYEVNLKDKLYDKVLGYNVLNCKIANIQNKNKYSLRNKILYFMG